MFVVPHHQQSPHYSPSDASYASSVTHSRYTQSNNPPRALLPPGCVVVVIAIAPIRHS